VMEGGFVGPPSGRFVLSCLVSSCPVFWRLASSSSCPPPSFLARPPPPPVGQLESRGGQRGQHDSIGSRVDGARIWRRPICISIGWARRWSARRQV